MPTSLMSMRKKKRKTTDLPTFHRVLLRKSGEYLFSISLIHLMIVSGYSNDIVFHKVIFTGLGECSIGIDCS